MPVALVTGASTGIGQATAISLARKGYGVHAAMRNVAAAVPLAEAAEKEGLRIVPLTMNVDDDGSVSGAVAGVLAAEGRIDVLVNNAGIGASGSVEEAPLAAFRQVMETNFFGVVRCIQAVVPAMRAQKSGFIANISSIAGQIALSPQAPYAVSKFAVEALSECLAQELAGFGVRVAIIEPGVIRTPMFTKGGPPVAAPPVYPHMGRLMAIFRATVPTGSSPFEVGDLIAELAAGGPCELRHRVGAYSDAFISWRQRTSDADWIALGAASDAEFARTMKEELGIEVTL